MTRFFVLATLAVALVACGGDSPPPSPTPTPTPNPAQPATATPQTATPTTTPSPTATTTPSPSPTPQPTSAATPTAAATATPTSTPEPAASPTPTPTPAQPAEPAEPVEPDEPAEPVEPDDSTPAVRPTLPQSPVFDAPPGVYTDITVGVTHACALTEAGEAVCWEIESGDVWDTPPGTYTFIRAEGNETCAIAEGGDIACWAGGGEPMSENESDPSHGAPPGPYTAISWATWVLNYEGDRSTYACALREGGEAVCWGSWGAWAGASTARPDPPPGPFVSISGPKSFGALGGQWDEICALSTSGEAVCWGTFNGEYSVSRDVGYVEVGVTGYAGLCGLTTDGRWTCGPDGWASDVRYTAMSTGGFHECAITDGGEAVCTGAERDVFAGDVMVMTPPSPAPGRFTLISAGRAYLEPGTGPYAFGRISAYACALTEAGRAVCWGSVVNKIAPPDPASGPYVAVSDGYGHTCALTESGEAVCWGWNNMGQLDAPPGRYSAISAGHMSTCAVDDAAEVVCWGGFWGLEPPPGDYIAVSTGGEAACGLTALGEAECWDYSGPITEGPLAVAPSGPFETISLTLGTFSLSGSHACARTRSGEVACWGSNREGETDVPQGYYRAVSASDYYTCAIADTGEVICWGGRYGWPEEPPAGSYVAISTGAGHACVLAEDGEPSCWGTFTLLKEQEDFGPVDPPPGRYKAISSGSYRACALTVAGRVVCWGDTDYVNWPQWYAH